MKNYVHDYVHSVGTYNVLKSKNVFLWPFQIFAEIPELGYGRQKLEMKVFQNYFVKQVKALKNEF